MAEPTDDPSSNDQASRFHTILTLLKISFGFLFELFPRPIVYFLEYSCWHFFTLLIGGSDIWNYPNVTKSFCDPISSHIFSLLLPACLSLHRKRKPTVSHPQPDGRSRPLLMMFPLPGNVLPLSLPKCSDPAHLCSHSFKIKDLTFKDRGRKDMSINLCRVFKYLIFYLTSGSQKVHKNLVFSKKKIERASEHHNL